MEGRRGTYSCLMGFARLKALLVGARVPPSHARHEQRCAVCTAQWTPRTVDRMADEHDAVFQLCPRCSKDRLLHVPLLLAIAGGRDPHGLRAEAWRRWANDVRREYRLRLAVAIVDVGLAAFLAGVFFEQWWCVR